MEFADVTVQRKVSGLQAWSGELGCSVSLVLVLAIIDGRSSLDHPLGDAIETFVRREDAEQFIANVKRDDPQLASHLRVVEREIETGGEN
jgi:hypothetical protein